MATKGAIGKQNVIAKIAEAFSDKLDPVFEALASKIQSAEAAEIIQALGAMNVEK